MGFGEAGTEIIVRNISDSCGSIEPMIKGKLMEGIFGFCDIRNFTDTTEVLQEEVMLFVNNIAHIVHSVTDHFMGTPNKNIGDAFLLVWKFSLNNNPIFNEIGKNESFPIELVKLYSELSCLCFLKIQVKLVRDRVMLGYRNNSKIQERMPEYKVKIK